MSNSAFSKVNIPVPVTVANGGTGNTSATAYAVLCGGTTSTGAFQSIASVGTAGQVLTSNGAGALPTFQTAATGVSSYPLYHTGFENTSRLTTTTSTGGTATIGATGLSIATSSSTTSSTQVKWQITNKAIDTYGTNGRLYISVSPANLFTSQKAFVGIGNVDYTSGTLSTTTRRIGFKLVNDAGTRRLYGTLADGSTEALTASLVTWSNGDQLELYADITGGSSVTFYYSVNGAAISAGTSLSSNFPTADGVQHILSFTVANEGTSNAASIIPTVASYQRK